MRSEKSYHLIVAAQYRGCFQRLPNYMGFLKVTNRSGLFTNVLVKCLWYLNSRGNEKHFIDFKDVPVCKNHNTYTHRVIKQIAGRGKTTKGLFFEFTLHAAWTADGKLECIFFASGNVKYKRALADLILDHEGIFVCDAGYLFKKEALERFFEAEKRLYIATRKKRKRLISKAYHKLFKHRSVIENL